MITIHWNKVAAGYINLAKVVSPLSNRPMEYAFRPRLTVPKTVVKGPYPLKRTPAIAGEN